MKKKLYHIVLSIGICLVVGILASFVTQTSVNDWYLTLNKPHFTPPNWVFAPIWTVLYVSMGISVGIVWAKGLHHLWVKTALYHFVFQLLLNISWSIIFFGLKEPFWALLTLITLLILLCLTFRWFRIVSKPAALLLLPYILWVCFATVLNYKIWELN